MFWSQSVFRVTDSNAGEWRTQLNEQDAPVIFLTLATPRTYSREGLYEPFDIGGSGNNLDLTFKESFAFPAFNANNRVIVRWGEPVGRKLNYNGTYTVRTITPSGGSRNADTAIVVNENISVGSGGLSASDSKGVGNALERRVLNFDYSNDGVYTTTGNPSRTDSNANTQITVTEDIPNNIEGGNLVFVEDSATKRAANLAKLDNIRKIVDTMRGLDNVTTNRNDI